MGRAHRRAPAYQVNADVAGRRLAIRTCKFMHCLPGLAQHGRPRSGSRSSTSTGSTALEVTEEVFESSASIVFDQAENRLHTIKAVMVATLGGLRCGSSSPSAATPCSSGASVLIAEIQQRHVGAAVEALAPLARDHELVVTHGNGPQVGVLALESARDPSLSRPYPFDVLGAETQGMIGYWLLQAFENALPGRQVASIVCQTVVEADDPAFPVPPNSWAPPFRRIKPAEFGY